MPSVAHNVLVFLVALLVFLTGWLAWLWAVRRLYRLERDRPRLLYTTCSDGWRIAVYHRAAHPRRYAEPVVLCHGLAANHYNLDFDPPYSVARYLAEAGFECFLVEWRGTGKSGSAPSLRRRLQGVCADDHIREDAPAVLRLALEQSGASGAFWIGHSLGGLVGYGVGQTEHSPLLKGLVTLGSPICFGFHTVKVRLGIRLGALASWPFGLRQRLLAIGSAPLLGYITLPFSDVMVNPKHIEPQIQRRVVANVIESVGRKQLLQFRDWVLNDAFRSFDKRTDYREGMARIQTPTLVVGGSSDVLAPPSCVRSAFERLGSTDKTLVVLGRENGDKEEYGHGDLIFGVGAPTEVYPLVKRWLTARATRIAQSDE